VAETDANTTLDHLRLTELQIRVAAVAAEQTLMRTQQALAVRV